MHACTYRGALAECHDHTCPKHHPENIRSLRDLRTDRAWAVATDDGRVGAGDNRYQDRRDDVAAYQQPSPTALAEVQRELRVARAEIDNLRWKVGLLMDRYYKGA
jgi:hypothetical protein